MQNLRLRGAELIRAAAPVLVPFAASRLLICVVILLSQMIVVPGHFGQPTGLVRALTNWDGAWYLGIAERGYEFRAGEPSNVGFFPLYPLLTRGAGVIFDDARIAAITVSNLCLLGAGVLLYRLVRLEFTDERISRGAVSFLMFSPVSFFFSSAYTESTFLLFSIGAFFAAARGRWLIACLCAMALSATRNVGVLIALPLLVEFVRQHWRRETGVRSLLQPSLLFFALVPLGLISFMLFTRYAFNDPLAYTTATAQWGRKLVPPWETLATAKGLPPFYAWLFGGALAAGILAWIAGAVLRLRPSYVVWAGVLIAIYICSNSLEAMPRFLSVVFPLFIVLAVIAARFDWSMELIFGSSVALLTVCTVLSANGYWMT